MSQTKIQIEALQLLRKRTARGVLDNSFAAFVLPKVRDGSFPIDEPGRAEFLRDAEKRERKVAIIDEAIADLESRKSK